MLPAPPRRTPGLSRPYRVWARTYSTALGAWRRFPPASAYESPYAQRNASWHSPQRLSTQAAATDLALPETQRLRRTENHRRSATLALQIGKTHLSTATRRLAPSSR